MQPAPNARAELVDRNGQVLALDLPRFGLYVDPHEMVHKADVRAALLAAMPTISAAKLDRILAGDKRQYVIGQLTPDQQQIGSTTWPARRHLRGGDRARLSAGLARRPRDRLRRRGRGRPRGRREGVRRAADPRRRRPGAGAAVDRPAGAGRAAERARRHAADAFRRASDAAGMVVNVRTGEILGMASWPTFDANNAAAADPVAHGQPRRRHGLRAGLGDQGVHAGHGARLRRRHHRHHVRRRTRPWCCRARPSTTTTTATRSLPLWRGLHPLLQHRRGAAGPVGRRATAWSRYFHALRPLQRRAERAGGIGPPADGAACCRPTSSPRCRSATRSRSARSPSPPA